MSGRRVTVAAEAGGWDVWVGPSRVIAGAALAAADPSAAWISPGVVGRSLTTGGRKLTECWLAALDLPAAVWQVSGDTGPVALEWSVSLPSGQDFDLSHDATRLQVVSSAGPWVELAVTGGHLGAERTPVERTVRVACRGAVPLGILLAAGADEAERARTVGMLVRGPARLAESWRHHGRSAARLETPDAMIDEAFAWAGRRVAARATPADPVAAPLAWSAETLSAAAARFLADPAARDPALAEAVLREAIGGLWGVAPDIPNDAVVLRPLLPADWPAMALRRLRVGRTLLDLELRRRRGDVIARVHRVFGPLLVVTLEPRGEPFEAAVVDEVELPGGRARFEVTDRHVVLFRGGSA